MTPVGHTLAGLTILAVAAPPAWGAKKLIPAAFAFVVLANAPDLPFPSWGHDRYDISHSIFTTALCVGGLWLIYCAFLKFTGHRKLPPRVLVGAGAAWSSHLLLDSFYNHGKGLPVLWPFGNGRLNFPLPWFETLRMPINYTTPHSLKIFGIEAIAYGILFIVVLGLRWFFLRKPPAPERH